MAGGCERCTADGTCTPAPCNFDCRNVTATECETLVMGGGGEFASTLSKAQKAACAMFLPCFYVEQCTEAMKAKEIAPGDIVTHVGGKFPQDMSDFAEMVRVMPKGTMLKILKPDGRRVDVEL